MAGVVSRQGARVPGALFLLVLLSGCATTLPDMDTLRADRLEPRVVLDEVPFHGQREYQCGPAALAMSLNASGVPATVDELIPQVYLPGREGSLQPEMLATARRHGRIPFELEPNIEALLAELEQGRPVLVLQNLALPVWPMWHYAVVIGYDLDARRLILHTGERPAYSVGMQRFDHTWARSGRWAMLTLPPGDLPARAEPIETAASISDFERVAGPAETVAAWRAMTERWPGQAVGWFALGNAEYGTGATAEAAESFAAATRHQPDFAAAWLNLGLTLEALDRPTEALEALERASALPGPWQSIAAEHIQRLSTSH
jgi:tetratricopeptide (TPR) repeat protein